MKIEYNGIMPVADMEAIEQAVESYIEENISIASVNEFIVHTEDSREEAVREYITESVWAFNSWFIEAHTPDGVTAEAIELLQEKCEGANDAILAMIEDIDDFINDAVATDGYGHFLSAYDGEEHEIEVEGAIYYIYAN